MNYTRDQIRQIREAQAREQFVRDAAFADITENIAGFEVRQMTLAQYMLLRTMGTPLLCNETPTPTELALFLWVLSPRWKAGKSLRRSLFLWRALWQFRSLTRCAEVLKAARDYIDETFQDRPPAALDRSSPDYYSDCCHWLALLGREYNQPFSETMRLPMKCILQFRRERQWFNDIKEPPLANPSEGIEAKFLAEMTQQVLAKN